MGEPVLCLLSFLSHPAHTAFSESVLGYISHTRNCSLYELMVIDPNSMSVCVPVLGCGKEGTVIFGVAPFWYRIAVSASWLRGIPVLFQVTHEAAPLWFRCVVLLLSCEAAGLSRPCSESAPGHVPPEVVLLILLWSCHFLSAPLHLHTKKRTLENGPLWVRSSGLGEQRKGLWWCHHSNLGYFYS